MPKWRTRLSEGERPSTEDMCRAMSATKKGKEVEVIGY